MRANKNSYNNFEQLCILNSLCALSSSSIKNDNNISSNITKPKKIILLQKTSPHQYPLNLKYSKKRNDYSSSFNDLNKTYDDRMYNNFSFINLSNVNENNLTTEIYSKNFDHKPSDNFYPNCRTINNNIDDLNKFKQSLKSFQHNSGSMTINNTNYMRDNRFISISPSHSSKDNNLREKSNGHNEKNQIEIEENINCSQEDNNNDNYFFKHKMRYLLSKN